MEADLYSSGSDQDTIVALSSAARPARRGIVRLSGPDAHRLAGEVWESGEGQEVGGEARRALLVRGRCRLGEGISAAAVVLFFYGPKSYTAEDMAELHLPGSPAVVQLVQRRLMELGARQAGPGEFTARAFLNGRMDLSRAEAVAEVIHAQSEGQLRAAGRLLNGELWHRCGHLAEALGDLLADVETGIDFADQELEFVSGAAVAERMEKALEELDDLLGHSTVWERLGEVPVVVIAGPVNAGKSTLMNALLGEERSIVSAQRHVTRDVLSAPLRLAWGECLLVDTAGLETCLPSELVDLASRQRAELALQEADVVVWVQDATGEVRLSRPIQVPEQTAMVQVLNKGDLLSEAERARWAAREAGGDEVLVLSAKTGMDVERLRVVIGGMLGEARFDMAGDKLALTMRQKRALEECREALSQGRELLQETGEGGDEIVALQVREGLDHLGKITGRVAPDDILGRIFSRFCVGK